VRWGVFWQQGGRGSWRGKTWGGSRRRWGFLTKHRGVIQGERLSAPNKKGGPWDGVGRDSGRRDKEELEEKMTGVPQLQ